MSEIGSFREIVGLWPSADAMADEIGASAFAARKWLQRDRIPGEWWHAIASTELAKQSRVTVEVLAGLAARRQNTFGEAAQ